MIDLITYGVLGLSGIAIALLIAYPLKFLWKPIHPVILSVLALIITNIIGHPFGFSVGINPITLLFVAILGVPGYTTLILFCLLF